MRPVRIALGAAGAMAGAVATGFAVLRPDRQPSTPLLPAGSDGVGRLPGGRRSMVRLEDGTRLAVAIHGPDDAPQVVLCHGWTNAGSVWDDVVELLDRRLRVVTWDQPGHGESDAPPGRVYNLDAHGDALRAVVDSCTHPGPLVLAGHSLGGITILNFARRHKDVVADRVVGLLLLSTMSRLPIRTDGLHAAAERVAGVGRWALDRGGRVVARAAATRAAGLTRALTRVVALGDGATPESVEAAARLFVSSDPDVLFGLGLPLLALDEDDALYGLDVPTVVMTGEDDRLTPPAYAWHLAHELPRAELVLLPDVGHMTPLEAAPVIARRLLELSDVEPVDAPAAG